MPYLYLSSEEEKNTFPLLFLFNFLGHKLSVPEILFLLMMKFFQFLFYK